MKNYLEFIVKAIVDQPGKVKVTESSQDENLVLNLAVDPNDMGKVIGKNGRIIKAIRNLLHTKAVKKGKRVDLLLVENSQREKGSVFPEAGTKTPVVKEEKSVI